MSNDRQLEEQLRQLKIAYEKTELKSSPAKIMTYIQQKNNPVSQKKKSRLRLIYSFSLAASLLIGFLLWQTSPQMSPQQLSPADDESNVTTLKAPARDRRKLEEIPQQNSLLIKEARQLQRFAQANSQKEADTRFLQFLFEMKKTENELQMSWQQNLQQQFYTQFPEQMGQPVKLKSLYETLPHSSALRQFLEKLDRQGFHLEAVGEAGVIPVIHYRKIDQLFSQTLSTTLDQYMQWSAQPGKIISDGAVTVSWRKLAQVLVNLEQLSRTYPEAQLNKLWKKQYILFINAFLNGLPNSPITDNGRLKGDVKESYQFVLHNFPDTETARIVRLRLANVQKQPVKRIEVNKIPWED